MVIGVALLHAFVVTAHGNWSNTSINDYYSGIDTSLTGDAFRSQLTKLVSVAKSISYAALWTAFHQTDVGVSNCAGTTLMADVYSTKCWVKTTEQCGSGGYRVEGDCYNREHSWPKSWWGGGDTVQDFQYTDLFHLMPADGYVNGRRNNFPSGPVSNPTYTSKSGGKLGPCAGVSYTGTCFEVADSHKGIMARAYFFISVRYRDVFTCCDFPAVKNALIKPWQQQLLKTWHKSFPVTAYEQRRNDLIYQSYQQNRNPFIDYPQWVDKIDFSV